MAVTPVTQEQPPAEQSPPPDLDFPVQVSGELSITGTAGIGQPAPGHEQERTWPKLRRHNDHMLAALVICVILALGACTLSAYMVTRVTTDQAILNSRHAVFCQYLAAQIVAVSQHPELEPLDAALRVAYTQLPCP